MFQKSATELTQLVIDWPKAMAKCEPLTMLTALVNAILLKEIKVLPKWVGTALSGT